jgi:hypothetical protein
MERHLKTEVGLSICDVTVRPLGCFRFPSGFGVVITQSEIVVGSVVNRLKSISDVEVLFPSLECKERS